MVIVWASWTEFVSNVLRVCLTTKPFLLPILINVFERTTLTTCKIRRRCKLWWFVVCPCPRISVFLLIRFCPFVIVFLFYIACVSYYREHSGVDLMGLKPNP